MSAEPGSADPADTRCGFVAVIGAPNAGKSTLINRLVGAKVSIVSPKVQTTRCRVLGIAIAHMSQIVYVDTPGIFAPKRRLDRAMVATAWQEAFEADVISVLVDVTAPERGTDIILNELENAPRSTAPVLVLNKIDQIRRDRLLEIAERLNQRLGFGRTFMISALNGDGVAALEAALAEAMPPSPWLYPEDQLSDLPMRLLAAEITREQIFHQLHRELPYSSAVETERWTEFDDGSVRIDQVIYVQRDTQKAIVLGAKGARIRAISTRARAELAEILERPVHLFLYVKVREDWAENPEHYRLWGLDFRA